MRERAADGRRRLVLRAFCLALIALTLGRASWHVSGWFAGRPPSYANEYARHIAFALTLVPLACVALLGLDSGPAPSRRRLALSGGLIALALAGFALDLRLQ